MSNTRGQLNFALGVCYAAMMCVAVAANLPPVFLTTLSTDIGGPGGLTLEQLGRIGSALFGGATLGILGSGPLADRLGAKPFAIAGNALIGVGLAVMGSARSFAAVLLAVFLMGLGAGTLDMVLSPIVSALQPHKRAAAMNWLHSFYCIGGVATILAGEWAMQCGWSWRAISHGMVVVPVLVCVGFAAARVPSLFSEQHGRTRLRQLCRQPFFVAALVAMFLVGAVELALMQWLPAYAEKGLGFTRFVGGMALLFFCAGMAVGRIGTGLLGHRVGAFPIMIGCTIAMIALVLVGSLAPPPGLALGACVGAGLAVSCLWPSVLAVASDRFPHGGGSMFGVLGATGNFGGLLMPWIVGATADLSTIHVGLATTAACPMLLVLVLVWMRRRMAPASPNLP